MKNDEIKKELLDEEELENISGGVAIAPGDYDSNDLPRKTRIEVSGRDSKGNPIYFRQGGREFYFVCPKCGRILHQGTFKLMYCDPCDDWWAGTEEQKVYK